MADDEGVFTLTIKGKPYSFNPEDLELGEAEWLEDELDSALEDVDWRRAKALSRLALVLLRREDPAASIEDVRSLKASDLAAPDEDAEVKEERPTEPPVQQPEPSEA